MDLYVGTLLERQKTSLGHLSFNELSDIVATYSM